MDDIEKILDDLDTGEADRLLQGNMDFPLDAATRARIAASVLEKAGIPNPKRPIPLARWIVGAAAAMLLVAAVVFYVVGPARVTAAITRMFSFIPGYGIVETEEQAPTQNHLIDDPRTFGPEIQHSVAELSSAENSEASMALKNVIATKDKIVVMLELKRKNTTEDQAIQEMRERPAGHEPRVTLRPGNSAPLKYYTFQSSSGGLVSEDWYTFKVDPGDINLNTVYRIEYADYHLFLDFKLKSIQSFESLAEIGATDTHNDISITAKASQQDGVLTVDLYPINKSQYRIDAFKSDFSSSGYMGRVLHLETSGGARAYRSPEDLALGPQTKFLFDISAGDKNLVLKIPYLMVATAESQNIAVTIPADGQTIALNQKVEFVDCTLIIVDAEKTGNRLKLTLQYDNKSPRKIMQRMRISRIDPRNGLSAGGGYQAKHDENGVFVNYQIHNVLDPEGATLHLIVHDPVYYLLDEYSLRLD